MSRRIKVAFVINDFLVAGAEKLLVELLNRLDRERFESSLVTLFYWEGREYLYDQLPADMPVYRLRFKSFRDIRSWLALYRALRTLEPDVVVSNLFFSNTAVRLLKPLLGFHVVAVEHNTYTGKTRLQRLVDRIFALWTFRIVAVSKTVAGFTAQQEHIPIRKFSVIPNGIDVEGISRKAASYDPFAVREELGIGPECRVLLNVARIVPQKNHALLLDAFAKFAGDHPEYRLVIVGSGNDAALKGQVRDLNIPDIVIFAGFQKDVARFYTIADWFVSTSLIEGFGIAHLEALACGVPVITTKTAGPDEMVEEGINGFFVVGTGPEDVVRALERAHAAERAIISASARRSAARYSIGHTVEQYQQLLQGMSR